MKEIRITTGRVSIRATLNDTPASREVINALPLRGTIQTWGEEIYFSIPVRAPREPGARQDVEVGELGYWPDGPAFCIFFGPTPASTGRSPRAYSPVNIIGRIEGDIASLRHVPEGAEICVEAVENES